MNPIPTIVPGWPAPARVRALFTTRAGGVSTGRWGDAGHSGGLNLGARCGDEPERVARNRQLLAAQVGRPIRWLEQVHGAKAVEAAAAAGDGDPAAAPAIADAQATRDRGVALGVLVADCLPVLFADRAGDMVAVAHAGWRGLAAGVLENTIALMRSRGSGTDLIAWLGPCIGPTAFEVGDEVRAAFRSQDPRAAAHFRQGARPGKWWADLQGLAVQRLQGMGVAAIHRSNACTVSDSNRFWSYRRDGACGRMAGVIWLQD